MDSRSGYVYVFSNACVQVGAELILHGLLGYEWKVYSTSFAHDLHEFLHIFRTVISFVHFLLKYFFQNTAFLAGDKRIEHRHHDGCLKLCQPLWRLIHVAGTNDPMIYMYILTPDQERDKWTSEGTAVCCKQLSVKLIFDVVLNLQNFVKLWNKCRILRIVKFTVADNQSMKVLLKPIKNVSKVGFPIAAGARKEHDARFIFIPEFVNFHKNILPIVC